MRQVGILDRSGWVGPAFHADWIIARRVRAFVMAAGAREWVPCYWS
jgi:hypothetical protein